MVNTVWLQPGEVMPESEDAALIERCGTPRFHVRGSAEFEGGNTFPTTGPFDTLDEALASTEWWAEAMCTLTIYLSSDCA